MEILFIFIFGLIVGSFLNVVIFRLYKGEGFLAGRSYCPWCKHQLRWYELVPLLSFVVQRGRCRWCRQKISWQYPLVEFSTGILFVLSYLGVKGQNLALPVFWSNYKDVFFYLQVLRAFIFTSFLLIIFVYDLKHYLILDKVTIPAMVIALFFNILLHPDWRSVSLYLSAGVITAGFFFFQYAVSHGKWIGGGDISFGFVIGFMLGWPQVVMALVLAYIIGALFGVFLLIFKKKKLDSQIPFGTFLSLGTFLALFWADKIYTWYANYLYNLL